MAISLAGVGTGVWLAGQGEMRMGLLLAGGSALAGSLGGLLYILTSLTCKLAGTIYRGYDAELDLLDHARRHSEHLRTISENSSLSDWAKQVAYREKDFEFLHDTIHGAIVRQDWQSAEHLITALERDLGYHDAAERLRAEVAKARSATLDEQLQAMQTRVERLCAARKWTQAAAEAERLARLLPGQDRIAQLGAQIETRRRMYKNELLRDYDQSIRSHDVDRAHQLLLELDLYLSPNEAAALKESARGVFKAKLLRLGVQFSLAVSDHQWKSAIEVGERVVREFPNSRYATEIRAMIPLLRQRAAEPAHAESSPRS